MPYMETTALEKIRAMEKRIRVVQGGTSAGKTIAILLDEINECILQPGITSSVITNSFPNLRIGALDDYKKIAAEIGLDKIVQWSEVTHTATFPNRSRLQFYSIDTEGALGARRDRLFINEANRIKFETFRQLETRTKQKITIDFNPVNEFWAHTEVLKRPDSEFIKLNYLDNEALDDQIIASIEANKGDGNNNWWRVYGLGEIGTLEGNIYEGWQSIAEIPQGYQLKRYGIDFGFSNDPTAIIAIYENEAGEIALDQKLCERKILTPELIRRIQELPPALCVCDSARPEIIAEMQANGIRAIGANKTPGEKLNGKRYNIELVQRRHISYTETSKELEREFLSYAWRKKSTGETIPEPQDGNDHCMDAIAYGIRDMERRPIQYAGVI